MSNGSNHSEKSKHGLLHRSLFFRFHLPHVHLNSVFGDDWFALKAEAFARFFGTPVFLIGQTIVVALWIVANMVGLAQFDVYPFILLNLAFSLQAAYAAPLILLAQTNSQLGGLKKGLFSASYQPGIFGMVAALPIKAVAKTAIEINTSSPSRLTKLTCSNEGVSLFCSVMPIPDALFAILLTNYFVSSPHRDSTIGKVLTPPFVLFA